MDANTRFYERLCRPRISSSSAAPASRSMPEPLARPATNCSVWLLLNSLNLHRRLLERLRRRHEGLRSLNHNASVWFPRTVLCRNEKRFMVIVNALAGIMVSDSTTAEACRDQQLLDRPADFDRWTAWPSGSSRTVDGFGVFQDRERAGFSPATFLVSGLEDQLAELKAKGISVDLYHHFRRRVSPSPTPRAIVSVFAACPEMFISRGQLCRLPLVAGPRQDGNRWMERTD